MSKTALLTIRIEPNVKSKLEKLYASFGLNISDAINMFIHQSLIVGGLPFELKDPFYRGEFSIEKDKTKEEIDEPSISDLKRLVPQIAKEHHVKKLYLIGSRARGDNRPNSDYNFIYELEEGHQSLLNVSGLMIDLEEIVGKEVDLTDIGTNHKYYMDGLKNDGILLYEKKKKD